MATDTGADAGDRARVRLLATGGTVANPPDEDGYLAGAELLERVPEVRDVAAVTAEDVASIASTCMAPAVWWRLHDRIHEVVAGDAPDGVVVTHGPNTVAETAYFLHLTLDTEVPVVLTAAQRNHGTAGADGRADVDRTGDDNSGDGPGEGRSFPRVEVVHSAAGTDGRVTDLLVEDGAVDGIVVAALPTGAPARPVDAGSQADALARAVGAGVPVVLSHRGAAGWPYEYEPFVRGDTLAPAKARILLGLALLDGVDDRAGLAEVFETY